MVQLKAEVDLSPFAAAPNSIAAQRAPKLITISQNASALESLAANEVQRYIYLRTGKVLPMKKNIGNGDRIVVACKDDRVCGELGKSLGPQCFTLKSDATTGEAIWWIVGGDEIGTLYGAYRFAEKLGVQCGLDEDIVPDERMTGHWPEMNETGKPRFALRGLQPFHDFSVGPDWWNLSDYQSLLAQLAKIKMNFIGFHTYPSWNPSTGPEANVWIGLPEDVDDQGNVRFGYEAGFATTRRGWEVKPFPTSQYASGGGLLFEAEDFAPDYMLDCLDWPKTEEAGAALFNRYGDFQKAAFGYARRLGIKTCLGTELPLGVPKALAARLESRGMKPENSATIRRLYEGTFLRLVRKVPLDYYWFWTPEVWLGMEPGCQGWEMTTRENVERDLGLAAVAAKSVPIPFGLATCGWRLGTRAEPFWMDKRTPKSWPASSINTDAGRAPVEKHYGVMAERPKWVIGWAEDDDTAGAHCCTCWDLQLWVERMLVNTSDAFGYGCEGMMAIHWRTAAIAPNITALARATWDFDCPDRSPLTTRAVAGKMPGMDAYWADWGREMFGGNAGAQVGRDLQKFDGGHLRINDLIRGGAKTTDAQIAEFFTPLHEMKSLRSQLHGAGNLDRFDYWYNLVNATHMRVRTWVMADRLSIQMNELSAIREADERVGMVRRAILPLRVNLARTYEAMIAAFVHGAKSVGDIGTIASIESGCRGRIVSSHDAALANILGEPLPSEAAISINYRGEPRIMVPARCTQMRAGVPQEIRAFVLSESKCSGVNLHWRLLGDEAFHKVVATHRNRQAYRVMLPAHAQGTVEYYLEAALTDGQKLLWPPTAPGMRQTAVVW